MPRRFAFSIAAFLLTVFFSAPLAAQEVLPLPPPKFKGQVGRTFQDSRPDFPQPVKPPAGAPNIVIVLLDDVGFGQMSTFGGGIPTPALDRLAQAGLRYNRFHTTALCSPTRAALLTGRNHHSVSTGTITELATGQDGYHSIWPKSAASIAEILKQHGYATAAFGKWHNTPDWETSAVGPFDRWPTGQGFEYFYGFLGGDTSQWDPALMENTTPVAKPQDPNYHLSADLADRAIAWIRKIKAIAPDKPFFAYIAPGATHAPHHAPRELIDKFKGKFDQGWDRYREETLARQKKLGVVPANAVLTPRPQNLPAWDSLSPDEKKLYARMMEVFAAYTAHVDHELGRVLDAVGRLSDPDNTLIIYIAGDNGASAEGGMEGLLNESVIYNIVFENPGDNLKRLEELGGPLHYNHYPAAWAWAMNTPFQWTKQVASHLGGTRNGMVIAWPRRIKDKGGIRSQFHHCIDIVPTILEVVGLQEPYLVNGVAQKPMEGISLAYTFDDAKAPGRRQTQYFEMFVNRGIYHNGWLASSLAFEPWAPERTKFDIDAARWELYNLDEDFTQARDLAAANPKKLRELQDLFWAEAARYQVLPLDYRAAERFAGELRPSLAAGRTTFTYFPGLVRLPEGSAPDLKNRSFQITVDAEIPPGGAEGMLVTQGGRYGGYGLFMQNGKLVFVHNYVGLERYTVESAAPVPAGKVKLRFAFAYDGGGLGRGGTGTLYVNDRQVGQGRIHQTVPIRFSLDETFDVGEDWGTPVTETYRVPFRFTGKLEKVTIEVGDTKPGGKTAAPGKKKQTPARAAD